MRFPELATGVGHESANAVVPVESSTVAFWQAMLRVTFGVFIGESIAVGVYVFNTPEGAHRLALGAIAFVSVLAGLVAVSLHSWIAKQSWRARFSLVWTACSSFALTAAASLDGGLRSPLLFLIMLPMAYAGLMFGPGAAAGFAAISIAGLATVAVIDTTNGGLHGQLLMVASATAGLGVLTWLSSLHRSRLDRRFAALTADLVILAATDHLTGCLNRRAFSDRLTEEIRLATQHRHPLSFVVADLDDFKRVNDTFGHPAGDQALERAGSTLRARSCQSDIVGRIGGDEFALLLPGLALDDAARHAQRMFGPYRTTTSCLTFSAGVATLDLSDPSAEDLFQEADRMLYHIKRGGGGGIALSTPSGEPLRLNVDLERRSA